MPRAQAAHEAIEHHLRDLLRAATPGDLLPSDRELSEQFNVSRMTARQAVATLVGEGRIYRVAGSGTYVSNHPVHRRVNRLLSFTEHMARHGRRASARVLAAGVRPGTHEENSDLHQPLQGDVCYLRRLLLGDDVPIAVEAAVLRIECRPVLDDDLEEGSLHAALNAMGLGPAHAMGTLSAEAANYELARMLDVPIGAALMVQRQLVKDDHEQPLQLVLCRYVGDRFVFDIDQYKHVYTDPHERMREPTYQLHSLIDHDEKGKTAPPPD